MMNTMTICVDKYLFHFMYCFTKGQCPPPPFLPDSHHLIHRRAVFGALQIVVVVAVAVVVVVVGGEQVGQKHPALLGAKHKYVE